MSRKIGLGDTFFDPDIDGDIDYDFFGGETPTTTAADTSTTTAFQKLREPDNLPMVAAEQVKDSAVPNTPVRNLFEESVNLNNNYDCEPLDDDVRNLNKNENVVVRESVIMAKADGSMASNPGTKELKMMNGDHDDAVHPAVVGSNVEKSDEVKESLNKKLNSHWCENESTEVGPVRNAEDGGGVRTKSSSCKSPKDNRQSNDDEDGSGLSDCDSASDLYSLTDEDDDDDGDNEDDDDDDVDDEGNEYFLENEGDLDSDITEVSPLSSANMSPLPDSPKRTPEPKAKRYSSHILSSPRLGDRSRRELLPVSSSSSSNNSEMSHSKKKQGSMANREENVKQDSVDLKVLAKAILELEEERKRNSRYRNKQTNPEKLYVRSRKNMTFTNDEVRRIDNENKRLLRRIIDSQKPRKTSQHPAQTGRIASSAINRFKELKKIETENLVLLKRLQAAKPTRELSREFLLGSSQKRIPESKSSSSIATTRTASPFVLSVGVGANKGRGGRCCSMGSLHSNSSSWSGLATSPTKTKSSKLTTNGLGTPHSIASGQ